ncbi:probable RNA polymerase II nuclear localization protein SLC7A6OS [Lates japonicus]
MLRECLSISGERLGEEHREQDDDYVYDLYYQETITPGWIQDILSVRAYADEGELVPDLVVREEEVYEDEDDENEEGNWRNDYPDEESDADSDREERYGGYWEEEHSYSRRSWECYQREVLHELGCRGEDDDEEDDDGDKYNSD